MYDNYGKPIVSLKLSDQKKFYEVTQKVSQMGSGNNLMVAWLDFDANTDSYAKEKNSENPKFISAATVSGGNQFHQCPDQQEALPRRKQPS